MIVRVRTSAGQKRISLSENSTLRDLKNGIEKETSIPVHLQTISEDQIGETVFAPDEKLIQDFGIQHGSIVYLVGRIEETVTERAFVNESGDIVPRYSHVQSHLLYSFYGYQSLILCVLK